MRDLVKTQCNDSTKAEILPKFVPKLKSVFGSFHKLHLHIGVGKWSETRVVFYKKSTNKGCTLKTFQ